MVPPPRSRSQALKPYELMSKLLEGVHIGDYIGTTIRDIKGDTTNLGILWYPLCNGESDGKENGK